MCQFTSLLTEHFDFSFFQTGIIIVDDCKLAVAVNFGTKAASFPCAAAQQLQIKDESENYRYIFM